MPRVVYTGESSFSGYKCLGSHAGNYRKDQSNAKHLCKKHPAVEGEAGLEVFDFKVTRNFRNPIERLICEAGVCEWPGFS